MSHGGGGVRNAPKKCHVLFEWPLNLKQSKSRFSTCKKRPSEETTEKQSSQNSIYWKSGCFHFKGSFNSKILRFSILGRIRKLFCKKIIKIKSLSLIIKIIEYNQLLNNKSEWFFCLWSLISQRRILELAKVVFLSYIFW